MLESWLSEKEDSSSLDSIKSEESDHALTITQKHAGGTYIVADDQVVNINVMK